jgi:hypothetical protein
VFPDGQLYYVLSGQSNPTKVDWWDPLALTPALAKSGVDDLQRDPPKVILVKKYAESDILHQAPLDFETEPSWRPIYEYITANYQLVRTVDDVSVYRLPTYSNSASAERNRSALGRMA